MVTAPRCAEGQSSMLLHTFFSIGHGLRPQDFGQVHCGCTRLVWRSRDLARPRPTLLCLSLENAGLVMHGTRDDQVPVRSFALDGLLARLRAWVAWNAGAPRC